MILSAKRALILAPHTDDGEFGCGGTIARLVESGADVFYSAFSICEESVPHHLPRDTLKHEVSAATQSLGIESKNLFVFNYQVRRFTERRQDILEDLVRLRNDLNPDLIFTPSESDIHQDHQVVHQESVRVFKCNSLWGYELPWNNLRTSYQQFVSLEEKHLIKKMRAIQTYKSQSHRKYSSESVIRSLAVVRGVQGGCGLAEAFEVIRSIIR